MEDSRNGRFGRCALKSKMGLGGKADIEAALTLLPPMVEWIVLDHVKN